MTQEAQDALINEGAINAPFVVEYIRSLVPEEQGRLAEMVQSAEARHIPIVQPEVAQWLRVFIQTRRFNRVLEVGTAIGYSTAIFAGGLRPDGIIETVEISEEAYHEAGDNLEALGLSQKVIRHLGDAAEVLPTLSGPFDLVFIDGAKGQYLKFLKLIEPMLTPDAVVLSDNVLFRGMIASDAAVKRRKRTIVKRMRDFMTYLMAEGPFDTALLPLGDGMAVSVLKQNAVKAQD